jgi:segregation and condensation protein A
MQTIELEDFSGPLDLLLALVQQEEISLTRIRLLEVLGQVLGGLEEERDLNESGDLLMIVSTLMELKSKLLLPGEVDIGEEIEALKEDLLAKVLVHRRLSMVLDALEYRFERRSEMLGRPSQLTDQETIVQPLEGQNPFVLFTSLAGLMEQARRDTLRVNYVMLPIDHYYEWIEKKWEGRGFSLREAFCARQDCLDATGVVIALLELVRQGSLIMEGNINDVTFEWGDPTERLKELEEEGMLNPDDTDSVVSVEDQPIPEESSS